MNKTFFKTGTSLGVALVDLDRSRVLRLELDFFSFSFTSPFESNFLGFLSDSEGSFSLFCDLGLLDSDITRNDEKGTLEHKRLSRPLTCGWHVHPIRTKSLKPMALRESKNDIHSWKPISLGGKIGQVAPTI